MTRYRSTALALTGALVLTAASVTSASAYWRGYRGWGWGPGIVAGLAAGALIGSAVAARPYYYGPPYPTYPTYYVAPPVLYGAPVAAVPYGYAGYAGYYGYGGYGGYYGYNGYYGSSCSGSYGQRRGCAWGDTSR